MASGFDVLAIGVPVRIDLDESVTVSALHELRRQWRDALVTRDVSPDVILRYGVRGESGALQSTFAASSSVEGHRRFVNAEPRIAGRVATDVTLAALEVQAGRRFLFHACAVALDDGRVIGFVGRSGMGKTTLAEQLGRRYGYVTDETLCVDLDRSVSAYQKPLSVGRAPHPKVQRAARELGMRIAPADGLRLAALVLLDRREEAVRPSVSMVRNVDALPAVAAHMSYFARMPNPLRSTSELAVELGGIRRVTYSDAASVAALVPEILAQTQTHAPVLADVDPVPDERTPGGYRRTHYIDALRIDGELLVLHGSTITKLNELAALIWQSAVGIEPSRLVETVTRELGAAPAGVDARTAIERNVEELVAAGLLVRD